MVLGGVGDDERRGALSFLAMDQARRDARTTSRLYWQSGMAWDGSLIASDPLFVFVMLEAVIDRFHKDHYLAPSDRREPTSLVSRNGRSLKKAVNFGFGTTDLTDLPVRLTVRWRLSYGSGRGNAVLRGHIVLKGLIDGAC